MTGCRRPGSAPGRRAGAGQTREQLPDYYVVLDADAMPVTRRRWWLGVLAGAASARVALAGASVAAVTEELGRLPSGRWWPSDTEGWLRGLPKVVPDLAAGLGAGRS